MMAGGIGLDPDAQAFLNAAGITDATITTAIDTLVIQLKAIGVWTKMKAIYPFVGGTATTHKFNLKNPADTNAAFRLSFSGGWTHSANGALPNGTNAYADTFLTPLGNLLLNSVHLSYYSITNQSLTDALMGCSDGSFDNGLYLIPKGTPNIEYSRVNQNLFTNPTGHPKTFGFFNLVRTASINGLSYLDGNLINTISATSTNLSSQKIYLGSGNFSVQQYSSCGCAFSSIGDGLTPTEAANYYTAVQSFQTTLNRQV